MTGRQPNVTLYWTSLNMRGRLYLLAFSFLWIAIESFGADSTRWCFQPLSKVTVPAETRDPWAGTPVDGFILAKLRGKGLSPQPEANREVMMAGGGLKGGPELLWNERARHERHP